MDRVLEKKGFTALFTAIIISVILLGITAALNQKGFFARAEILDSEYKFRSMALAEACADIALLKLAEDLGYSSVSIENIGGDSCEITSISFSAGEVTIIARARYPLGANGAVSKLRVVAGLPSLGIISWQETP